MKIKNKNATSIDNRKSRFNYEWLETFMAGVKLTGTEIKSIRNGDVSIDESYCYLTKNGMFVKNMYIKEYALGDISNHDPLRERILLLTKKELSDINKLMINKGLTLIPTKLYINEKGLCKINVSVCKGRKSFEKREYIKDREIKKELKNY